jgi:hypothetical protein
MLSEKSMRSALKTEFLIQNKFILFVRGFCNLQVLSGREEHRKKEGFQDTRPHNADYYLSRGIDLGDTTESYSVSSTSNCAYTLSDKDTITRACIMFS